MTYRKWKKEVNEVLAHNFSVSFVQSQEIEDTLRDGYKWWERYNGQYTPFMQATGMFYYQVTGDMEGSRKAATEIFIALEQGEIDVAMAKTNELETLAKSKYKKRR